MTHASPNKAFILAAGLGTRMRPLTEHCPKPLVAIGGKSLLMRTLDHLEDAGVHDVVINTHYLGEQIPEHLKACASFDLYFSHEEMLLDTGGGIKAMLSIFNDEAFYVLSGDGLWENEPGQDTLLALSDFWDGDKMDILLLLQPVSSMSLTQGVGDYTVEAGGRIKRSKNRKGSHMFTSIRINHPRIFQDTPDGAFSYLELMDRAEKAGRLYGMVHEGSWHHISTPEDLETVRCAYKGETYKGEVHQKS